MYRTPDVSPPTGAAGDGAGPTAATRQVKTVQPAREPDLVLLGETAGGRA
jgi:hypothetical protein